MKQFTLFLYFFVLGGCCASGKGNCAGNYHQEVPNVYDIWWKDCKEDKCNSMDPTDGLVSIAL